jgi:hypothetical protein
MMVTVSRSTVLAGAAMLGALAAAGAFAEAEAIVRELNSRDTIQGTARIKSYEVLFDAYLQLSTPPFPVGPEFNLTTIHPGMAEWDRVSGWAEGNGAMARAIIECRNRQIVGLPYGRNNVKSSYQRAGIMAEIAVNGILLDNRFPYLQAVDVIAAFATAEAYRRFEAGQSEEAVELLLSHMFVARQFCDREFLAEKVHSITLLTEVLANMRDMFERYQDRISAEQFRLVAAREIPSLRPDRNKLFMPEADRVVAEAVLRSVFDSRGQADPERFASVFSRVQAKEAPLTRFGAAKRWENIAHVHGSLEASLERLTWVYDDWWRRWRVQEYDQILAIPTQFSRTNPYRYAAVLYAIQDIEGLFAMRRQLIAATNGTAIAAGLCAYKQTFGVYPPDQKMIYAQFVRKSSDIDPWDRDWGSLLYMVPASRHPIDTPAGRLWVEPGEAILYSRGQDHGDGRAQRHTDDGVDGDIVLWPPIRHLSREQGLVY